MNNASKFKPTVDIMADTYLEGKKVQLTNPDGSHVDNVGSTVNLFAGTSYHPIQSLYISFVAGPSWMGNGQRLMAIKPSFGFHFSPTQRWTAKISYINVFNRDMTTKEDFGSISLSLGMKLF
ncbi:MAG TPA: hypothetical protein PKA53_13205 [Sphingobacterium sp.]|nr:hypothetical protein [Sphingobacterium sp.]